MDNLDFILSLFSQYLFIDAKNNIEDIEYYFSTNPATQGNKLIEELVYAIKNYNLENIDLPLFQSICAKTGKTAVETKEIIDKIIQWKTYDKGKMAPAKKYLQDLCSAAVIQRANRLYPNDPTEFLSYIKKSEIKVSKNLDLLVTNTFSSLDINTLVADENHCGVPSYFDFFNKTFAPHNVVEFGQLVCLSMPPGCFSGDTEVFLADGTVRTMKDLAEDENAKNFSIYSCCGEFPRVSVAEKAILTKYVNELLEVETNDGGKIKVTPDHRFMMIDGSYKKAEDLQAGDLLMLISFVKSSTDTKELFEICESSENREVVSIKKITFDNPEPVYDIMNVDLYSNFAIKTSENSGIIVHNCGKSLWAMTEALHMASKGYRVLYAALGDLKLSDFIIRLAAIYSGLPFWEARKNITNIYRSLCTIIGDNLGIICVPAGKITVDEYVEYVKSQDYDVLIADYDGNFKTPSMSDSMYLAMGEVYDKLTELTAMGKLVYILAQPVKASWDLEAIELNQVGESAKKIQICDILITRGRCTTSPNHLGIVTIAKNRRGEEGVKAYTVRLNNGRFRVVPYQVYMDLKRVEEKMNWTDADIDAMIEDYERQHAQIQSYVAQAQKSIASPQLSYGGSGISFSGDPQPTKGGNNNPFKN